MNQSGARSITHEKQAGFHFTRRLLCECIKVVCFFALIGFVFKPGVINVWPRSTGTRLGANEETPVPELARMYDPQLEHHWIFDNEEDFTACLGFEVEGADENLTDLEVDAFKKMIASAIN